MSATPDEASGEAPGVALVTGASGTIGGEIARVLSRRGYFVAVHAFSARAAADEVCDELPGPSEVVEGDISDPATVSEIVGKAAAHGPIEVVVNAAGMMRVGLLATQPVDDWTRMIDINLVGPYLVCRATVPSMLRRRRGRVINIVSPAAVRASRGQTAYAASKAGLLGFTRHLAMECSKRGVTVNAISPGFVDSKMTADVTPEVRAMILERVIGGRAATAAEVASAVDLILGCDYLTGEVIAIDGGASL
jgi:3-oxoacyl-[acyl-carrier protein] reductase